MEQFLAQHHASLTHLPIASAALAALAALVALVSKKTEYSWAWAVLSIVAFITVIPTIVSGVQAGIGRNYIEPAHGYMVTDTPDNADIRLHQQLGIAGTALALVAAALGIARLRGKAPNKYLLAALAVALAVIWGVGGHLGGEELWGPDTFPGFDTEQAAE